LAAATALAVELAVHECDARAASMRRLRDLFLDELRDCPGLELLTREPALPNTLLVRCHAVDGRLLLPALDVAGIAASQGSACSSGSPQPPRVLRALGLDDAAARQCVRFSLAAESAASDVIDAARILRATITRMSRTTS
jgi:cysteine desulfurase